MFCRSLFVLLYFFFWPLCCLFLDIRILIAPLVSSNSSSSPPSGVLIYPVVRSDFRIKTMFRNCLAFASTWVNFQLLGGPCCSYSVFTVVFLFCLSSSCVHLLSMSLDSSFLMAPSAFSNVYLHIVIFIYISSLHLYVMYIYLCILMSNTISISRTVT